MGGKLRGVFRLFSAFLFSPSTPSDDCFMQLKKKTIKTRLIYVCVYVCSPTHHVNFKNTIKLVFYCVS